MFLISSTRDIGAMTTSNTDSDDEDNESGGNKKRKITVMMWAGVEAETVGRLPEGIDDLKVYNIKNYCNSDALQDGRKSNGLERPLKYALCRLQWLV